MSRDRHPLEVAIADALATGRKTYVTGRGTMTYCPQHRDRSPSLSILVKDDRVLVNCHAGCDGQMVLADIRAMGFDTSPTRPGGAKAGANKRHPVITAADVRFARTVLAIYDYRRRCGEPISVADLATVREAKRTLALAKRLTPPRPPLPIPWMIRIAGGNEVRIDAGERLRGLTQSRCTPVAIHWPPEIESALICDQCAPEAVLHNLTLECLRAGAKIARVASPHAQDGIAVYRREEASHAV